jgi:hypothetical protein
MNESTALANPVKSDRSELVLAPEARALVTEIVHVMQRQTLAAMHSVKLELKAIVNDNSVLRENLSLMNRSLGEFQERTAIPLAEGMKEFNHNSAGRVAENQARLETLIQALTRAVPKGLIADDLSTDISDGRFEDHEHRIANEMTGAEIRGYVRQEVVQGMIAAAVETAVRAALRGVTTR